MNSTTPSSQAEATNASGRGVSRRAVTRGLAWAAPVAVIAVDAPAFAASGGCEQVALVSSFSSGDQAHVSKLVDGLTFAKVADIAYAASRASGNNDPYFGNQTGWLWQTPDPGWDAIRLHHPKGMSTGDTLTMTIGFVQPVNNLTFTISDIDGFTTSWIDHVVLSPTQYGFTTPVGGVVTGDGTAASPFASNHEGGVEDHSGDVTLTWLAPVSVVTITYTAADLTNKSDIGQMIQIGQFAYQRC
jgi:hypothetical protein